MIKLCYYNNIFMRRTFIESILKNKTNAKIYKKYRLILMY